MTTEREARKIIAEQLQTAILKARDDGLPRPEAEAVLWRVYRYPPGSSATLLPPLD